MTENKRTSKRPTAEPKSERLAPGELDKLVLGYMRRHKKAAPHTASAVAKGIKRSSGAVANCLGRQEKKGKVRLAKPKPREYELAQAKKSKGGIQMPDPKVSTIRMPDSMKSDLAAIARSRDMSVADAIAEALELYITARKSEERFKERLEKRLEEDREVLDRLGEN